MLETNGVEALEHHTEERQQIADPMTWKIHQNFVVQPLLKMGLDEGLIQRVLGTLLVNTISIEKTDVNIMGLFLDYSLLNHNCIHNTKTKIELGTSPLKGITY